jgi:hypothetical protein
VVLGIAMQGVKPILPTVAVRVVFVVWEPQRGVFMASESAET